MKKKLVALLSFLAFNVAFVAAIPVYAVDVVDCSDPKIQQSTLCQSKNTGDDALVGPDGILTKGISILSIVVGIAAVVSIIISALRLIMSGGDPNTISGSRRGILFAVIGLAIAASAQLFVRFILSRVGS
jgi:hypothetical protein